MIRNITIQTTASNLPSSSVGFARDGPIDMWNGRLGPGWGQSTARREPYRANGPRPCNH